jgi:hypothetical protein
VLVLIVLENYFSTFGIMSCNSATIRLQSAAFDGGETPE